MNIATNRLINEQSPYLLQHAHNPVDWRPWGEEAFAEARKLDKPLFLSVGYATCHWCHVMERESFEDRDVARLINDTFVPVKVDREERPDIDTVYMSVCQAITGSGGWPLTVFLTPDREPFFSATYIAKESQFGRMGLMELIPRVHTLWTTRRDDVLASANAILDRVQSIEIAATDNEKLPNSAELHGAFKELSTRFDPTFGGFGTAPKFPSPHNLMFLLSYHALFNEPQALRIALKTLTAMRNGGIFDQVGYGFHRYSTDRVWLLPHFEKMLYDQAMLMLAYTEAYLATGDELYKRVCREIFTYLTRDLSSPDGTFYSAEDADSEGEEGLFYLFSLDQIRTCLGPRAELAVNLFGLRERGNYRDEATGETTGLNILHLPESMEDTARSQGLTVKELEHELGEMRRDLFALRERRERPLLDDKILTDWNGLAIAALARAGRILGEADMVASAGQAADFFLQNMTREDSGGLRLQHRYRNGHAAIEGFLDDYAFFTWALLELHQAVRSDAYLESAKRFMATLGAHFRSDSGLYHLSPNDGDPLPLRPLESYDAALPSGNSVTLHNLMALSRLTGDTNCQEKAHALLRTIGPKLARNPAGSTFVLYAMGQNMVQ